MSGICHTRWLSWPFKFSARKPKISLPGRAIVLLVFGILLVACGGGRNKTVSTTTSGDELDIDKLLNTPEQEKQQSAEDDEVLRLLGISPETKKAEPASASQTAESPSLEQQVQQLQQEVDDKNRQVTQLRSQVAEKDLRIQELEEQSSKSRSPTQNNLSSGTDGFVQRYAEARNLYEQRRYGEAMHLFETLLAENNQSNYADNCQYWIGECYYGLGQYAQAIAAFEKVFTFPRSNKNDAALLKIGLCYLRLDDRQQARSAFEQLIANYPSSQYVSYARRYLSRL